jgi:ABC-2 type transport system permease protein
MNSQTLLVAKNVYRNRIKTAGFWALVVVPLLVPIIALVIGWIAGNSSNTTKLAIINEPQLVQVLGKSKALPLTISETSSTSSAKSQLEAGKIDGFLEMTGEGSYQLTTTNKTSGKFNTTALQSVLTELQISARAGKLGLTGTELAGLLAPAHLSTSSISTTGQKVNSDQQASNSALAIVTALIVMLFCSLYVGVTAQEISNEKSNRIMEILLAATSARTQYYGKIIGVMLLALTQIAIYALGFSAAFFFLKDNSMVKSVTSMFTTIDVSFLLYTLGMVIFAIVGYVFIAAIVSSLINDQSQVQQATSPIMYIALIGYIGSIISASNPTNPAMKILSFIPFISPTLMSARYAIGIATPAEAVAALVLQIVAVLLLARFGEGIYARNVLSYSNERIFHQLISNIRGGRAAASGQKFSGRRLGLSTRFILAGVIIVIIIILRMLGLLGGSGSGFGLHLFK